MGGREVVRKAPSGFTIVFSRSESNQGVVIKTKTIHIPTSLIHGSLTALCSIGEGNVYTVHNMCVYIMDNKPVSYCDLPTLMLPRTRLRLIHNYYLPGISSYCPPVYPKSHLLLITPPHPLSNPIPERLPSIARPPIGVVPLVLIVVGVSIAALAVVVERDGKRLVGTLTIRIGHLVGLPLPRPLRWRRID